LNSVIDSKRKVPFIKVVIDLISKKMNELNADQKIEEPKSELEQLRWEMMGAIHDLGHPVGDLVSFFDVALHRINDPEYTKIHQEKDLKWGMQAAEYCVELIRMLQFYNHRRDEEDISFEKLNLREEGEYVLRVSALGKRGNITLENNIPENEFAYANQCFLKRIYFNLIGNATRSIWVKEGKITLEAERQDELYVCRVIDTGKGFGDCKLNDLFGETRLEPLGTVHGMGLITCKRLVEKLGGTFDLRSEGHDKGATAEFTLPRYQEC
jgi:signal transduction histidine kinase